MADEYSPQSPDLSGFFSGPPTTTNQPPLPPPAQTSFSPAREGYDSRSPNISPFANPYSPRRQQQQQAQAPASQPSPGRNPGYTTAYQQIPRQLQFQPQGYSGYNETVDSFQNIPQGQGQAHPIPSLPTAHRNFAIGAKSPTIANGQQVLYDHQDHIKLDNEQNLESGTFLGSEPRFSPTYQALQPSSQYQSQSGSLQPDDMATRSKRERNIVVKSENGSGSAAAPGLGPSQGIEVRTKFPVARIKRIMQADEEVGKVAQVTPVAVSKALELFMISVVTKSAALAREGNSKRVSAQHLKKAIEADEQFDFLNDIVSKVVEGPEAGGKRVKDDDDSDDEETKPKKARGRKKKE